MKSYLRDILTTIKTWPRRAWRAICRGIVFLLEKIERGIKMHPLTWALCSGGALIVLMALVFLPAFIGGASAQALPPSEDVEVAGDLAFTDESYTEEIYGESLPEWDWTAYFMQLHDEQGQEGDGEDQTLFKRGDVSPNVNRIQRRLAELDYWGGDETTEEFGPVTEMAVQLFQRTNELQVDGVVGQETWDFLMSDQALPYMILPGNKGTDVIDAQSRLKELGYLSGKVTGFYGDETEKAVRAFQKNNGLTVDAKIGVKTRYLLFSPKAKPAVKPTPKPTAKPGSSALATPKASSKITKMIEAAKGKLGKSYVWSAVGPNSFDCSGFVYYSLKQAGLSVSRYNAAGYAENDAWKKISSISSLKKGDLIFWKEPGSSRVSHAGIYLGGNEFIHASSGKGKVVITSFSNYWRDNFVCGRRPFP